MSGFETIGARVAEIQSRFARPAATTVMGGQNLAPNTVFADRLASAMGDTSTVDSSLSGYNSASKSGADALAAGMKYVGTPYVWGGTTDKGLDCSGLVQKAYGDIGVSLPRHSADQARQGTPVASLAQAKPGDLLAFGTPVDHIGIYAGDNKMLVAPKRGDVVKIQDVYATPTAIRRVIPETAQMSFASAMSTFSGGATAGLAGPLSSQYNSLFAQAGAKYGISPTLLAAVAKTESSFNANAGSGAGARGLMQLMPSTAKSLGVDPMKPAEAIDGAARMLSGLVKKFGTNELALAAYNAGPGAVEKYGGIPPYTETQNYVKKVMSLVTQGGGI